MIGAVHDPNHNRRLHFRQITEAFRNVVCRHAQERLVPGVLPEPASPDSIIPGEIVVLNHVLWLCNEVDRLTRLDLYGEAVEHVGTIRGVLWTAGVMSLEESTALTKNPGKEGQGT